MENLYAFGDKIASAVHEFVDENYKDFCDLGVATSAAFSLVSRGGGPPAHMKYLQQGGGTASQPYLNAYSYHVSPTGVALASMLLFQYDHPLLVAGGSGASSYSATLALGISAGALTGAYLSGRLQPESAVVASTWRT